MACVSTNDCRCILGVTVFIYYKQLSHFQYTQTDMARNYNFTICNNNHSLHNKMQFSDLIHPEDRLLWSVLGTDCTVVFFFVEPYEIGFIEEPSNSSSVTSNLHKRSVQGYPVMKSLIPRFHMVVSSAR